VTFIDPQQIFVRHLDHHVAWHGASEATDDKSVAMLRFRVATQICFDVMQELARKTLLGSADMRLWVVQQDPVVVAAPETPVSPSSPSKLLYNLSSALDKADCSARLGNHFIGVFLFLNMLLEEVCYPRKFEGLTSELRIFLFFFATAKRSQR